MPLPDAGKIHTAFASELEHEDGTRVAPPTYRSAPGGMEPRRRDPGRPAARHSSLSQCGPAATGIRHLSSSSPKKPSRRAGEMV
jgi:hypothetical protein